MEQRKPIGHVVAGLIIGGALVLLSLVFSGDGGMASGWLPILMAIGGLVLFIYLYGKANNNQKTFGELFSYGFKATAVLTLILVVFIIMTALLFPEMKTKVMEMSRLEMEKQNKLSDDEIDSAVNMLDKYYWAFAIGGTMLMYVILGAIGSLIGAAVTPKRPKTPFDQLSI
jgi:NADH:ubiquinone oxidoreductase subunit 6 (subunit J)